MSYPLITKLLEQHIEAMPGVLATEFENVNFKPVTDVPYQSINILFATPENPTFGNDFRRIKGYVHIQLRYPRGEGPGAAMNYADQLGLYFPRGLTLTSGNVTVIIDRTPDISKGGYDGDRYLINVKIMFLVNLEG